MDLWCIAGPDGCGDQKIVLPMECQLQSLKLFLKDKTNQSEQPYNGNEDNLKSAKDITVKRVDKCFNLAEMAQLLHQNLHRLDTNYFIGDKDKRIYCGPILHEINAQTYGKVKANKLVFFDESPVNSSGQFEPKLDKQVGVSPKVKDKNEDNSEDAILFVFQNGSVIVKPGGHLIFDMPLVVIQSSGEYMTISGGHYNRLTLKSGFHVCFYVVLGVPVPVLFIRHGKGLQKLTTDEVLSGAKKPDLIVKTMSGKDFVVERIVVTDESDDKYVPQYIFDWIKSKGYVIERGSEEGRVLGMGPTSVVRRGTRLDDRKTIAAKIIVAETGELKARREQPSQEIFICRKVNHKYLVKYLDIYCVIAEMPDKLDRMSSVVIMETETGATVRKYVESEGKVAEDMARQWFQQLMEAIAYLHGRRIAHRHIRLNNCLICDDKSIKLCDFSRAVDLSSNNSGQQLPTEADRELSIKFMPPEYFSSESPVDPFKVDIWMTGCVLYSLMSANLSPFGVISMNDKQTNSQLFQDFCRKQTAQVSATIQSVPEFNEKSRDLMSKLWTTDPMQRLDAKSVLSHDWLK